MNDDERTLLLYCLMKDIRGNWNDPGDRIRRITSLCDEITTIVPKELLGAIKKNAETFDGCGNDGRIFRDGQMFLPDGVIAAIGLPSSMEHGVSGNMAKLFGATPVTQAGGFRGTYGELSTFVTLKINDERTEGFMTEFNRLITYPEYA